jgi:hypothetical protein
VFEQVPRIVIASITAEVVSELIDGEVYSNWKKRVKGAPQWTRVAVSNGISLPIDSIIFVVIAFAGTLPVQGLLALIWGQIVIKAIITVVSVPAIYLVSDDRQIVLIENQTP